MIKDIKNMTMSKTFTYFSYHYDPLRTTPNCYCDFAGFPAFSTCIFIDLGSFVMLDWRTHHVRDLASITPSFGRLGPTPGDASRQRHGNPWRPVTAIRPSPHNIHPIWTRYLQSQRRPRGNVGLNIDGHDIAWALLRCKSAAKAREWALHTSSAGSATKRGGDCWLLV